MSIFAVSYSGGTYKIYGRCDTIAIPLADNGDSELVVIGKQSIYYTKNRRHIMAYNGRHIVHEGDCEGGWFTEIGGKIYDIRIGRTFDNCVLVRGDRKIYLDRVRPSGLNYSVLADNAVYVLGDTDVCLNSELSIYRLGIIGRENVMHRQDSGGLWMYGSVWTTGKCADWSAYLPATIIARDPREPNIRRLCDIEYNLYVRGGTDYVMAMGPYGYINSLYEPRADAIYYIDHPIQAYTLTQLNC